MVGLPEAILLLVIAGAVGMPFYLGCGVGGLLIARARNRHPALQTVLLLAGPFGLVSALTLRKFPSVEVLQ